MYIAHHLLTLGHQFRPKLPEPLNQSVASFVDLVPTIRQMGEKCFLEQLVSMNILSSVRKILVISFWFNTTVCQSIHFMLIETSLQWSAVLVN